MPTGSEAPYIPLSTPHVEYREDTLDPGSVWKHVILVLAELAPSSCALVICPALDCDLAPYPVQPIIQFLFPEDNVCITACNSSCRSISLSQLDGDIGIEFSLRFEERVEFWDFLRVVSNAMAEAEVHRCELRGRLPEIINKVPSHKSLPGTLPSCSNLAHAPGVYVEQGIRDHQ